MNETNPYKEVVEEFYTNLTFMLEMESTNASTEAYDILREILVELTVSMTEKGLYVRET